MKRPSLGFRFFFRQPCEHVVSELVSGHSLDRSLHRAHERNHNATKQSLCLAYCLLLSEGRHQCPLNLVLEFQPQCPIAVFTFETHAISSDGLTHCCARSAAQHVKLFWPVQHRHFATALACITAACRENVLHTSATSSPAARLFTSQGLQGRSGPAARPALSHW